LCIIPPFAFGRSDVYHGKLEALYTALNFLKKQKTEYVVLSDAITICNIDYREVLADHIASGKDVTAIASKPRSGANNYPNASDGLAHLVENTSKEDLKVAMQTDAEVLSEIAKLEEKYAAQQGITVKPAAVTEEAAKYVDVNKVSIIGAALNAKAGEEVKLNIAVPVVPENIDSKYQNAVQIDIKLLSGSKYLENLDVPVTITMPIPSGVSLNNLRILHYHAGAKNGEQVLYSVDSVNKTITFTVTGFSTFVFANEVAQNTQTDTNTNSNVAVTSPKTADTNTMLYLMMLGMVCLVGVVFATRKIKYSR